MERDRYDSTPGFEGGDPFAPPKGGDAKLLCAAFGSDQIPAVNSFLRANARQCGALRRHEGLIEALDLPEWAAGLGYDYIYQGEGPEELDRTLRKTTASGG